MWSFFRERLKPRSAHPRPTPCRKDYPLPLHACPPLADAARRMSPMPARRLAAPPWNLFTEVYSMSVKHPKSWFAFLIGAGVGSLLFLPLAAFALALEHIPFFLGGLAGAAAAWFVAAFMGILLARGIRSGR